MHGKKMQAQGVAHNTQTFIHAILPGSNYIAWENIIVHLTAAWWFTTQTKQDENFSQKMNEPDSHERNDSNRLEPPKRKAMTNGGRCENDLG